MKRFRISLLGLLALAISFGITLEVGRSRAQAPAGAEKRADSNDEAEIRALIDRYAKALRGKDIDAVMSLYAPGVAAFDLEPPLKYVGKDSYKNNFVKFFDSFQAPIEIEIRDLSIAAGGDVGFCHSLQHISGTTKAGEKADIWVRVTSGFRKVSGKWLITHDHTSVPIDMETGKAALDLKP